MLSYAQNLNTSSAQRQDKRNIYSMPQAQHFVPTANHLPPFPEMNQLLSVPLEAICDNCEPNVWVETPAFYDAHEATASTDPAPPFFLGAPEQATRFETDTQSDSEQGTSSGMCYSCYVPPECRQPQRPPPPAKNQTNRKAKPLRPIDANLCGDKYKTEMCLNMVENGFCRYGAACVFAHSQVHRVFVSCLPTGHACLIMLSWGWLLAAGGAAAPGPHQA